MEPIKFINPFIKPFITDRKTCGYILFSSDAVADCAVCQDKLKLNEEVRQLPCNHLFHFDCIEPWLKLVSIIIMIIFIKINVTEDITW